MLASPRARDHQPGLAGFSRSHLVHAPALGPLTTSHASAATPLSSESGLPGASPGDVPSSSFPPSVPLEILTDAYHSQKRESGVSAAGSNLADVSSTYPPKLTGHRAHVK